MRLKLANDLESRDGTVSRDAGLRNAFIEKEGEWSAGVLKRPGAVSSTLNYVTPQGFSSLSFTDLPYEGFASISDLLFGINGDSWTLNDISGVWAPSVAGFPVTQNGDIEHYFRWGIRQSGGFLYGVAEDDYLYKSSDFGITWEQIVSTFPDFGGPSIISSGSFDGFFSDDSYLFGFDDPVLSLVWRSSDGGVTWVGLGPHNMFDYSGFRVFWVGGKFVSLRVPSPSGWIMTSTDGVSWVDTGCLAANVPNFMEGGFVHVGGRYFSLASPGKIASSVDLVSWSITSGFGWTATQRNVLVTDGSYLMLYSFNRLTPGYTFIKMQPSDLAIVDQVVDSTYTDAGQGVAETGGFQMPATVGGQTISVDRNSLSNSYILRLI